MVSFNGADLFNPSGLAFGADGKLYVSGMNLNSAAGEVQRFLTDGTPDGVFISSGLNNPNFMAFSVPEPNSVVLAGFAIVAFALRGWRAGNRVTTPARRA